MSDQQIIRPVIRHMSVFLIKFVAMCTSASFIAIGISLAALSLLIPFAEIMIHHGLWPTTWIGEGYVAREVSEIFGESFKLFFFSIAMYVIGWQIECWVRDGGAIDDKRRFTVDG